MNYILIIFLFLFSSCIDLEIADNQVGYGNYMITATTSVRSNTNFPIESALVKMEWRIPSYFDYIENEWNYDISNQDSDYTNSSGDANLSTFINSTYLSTEDIPEVSFYVSCSGFKNDTIIIDCESFNSNMWDSTYNTYTQNISHTVYLVPQNQ